MPPLLSDLDQPAPIVLAPTGMVPTRAMTPHVPLTPAEIAADVAAAASIGITSVHLHARGDDGDPTWEREVYQRIVGAVREAAPEVVINVSTSGRTWSEVERRADCLALDGDLKPDLASLTLSSLNFLTQASINSPDTIHALATIMRDRGIVPELEVFDLGMVNYVHVLQRKGLLPGPVVANMFFGNVAGMQATLAEMGLAIDRLPPGTIWSGAGLGDFAVPVQSHSVAAGGGVRVGLEDGIWFDRGRTRLATNPMLVERVHELLALHGRSMMAPDELRARLAG